MASVYVRNAHGLITMVNEGDYDEFIAKQPMVRNPKTGRMQPGGVELAPDSPEVIAHLKAKKEVGEKMMQAQAKIDMAGSPVLKAASAVIAQAIKDGSQQEQKTETKVKSERKTKEKTETEE